MKWERAEKTPSKTWRVEFEKISTDSAQKSDEDLKHEALPWADDLSSELDDQGFEEKHLQAWMKVNKPDALVWPQINTFKHSCRAMFHSMAQSMLGNTGFSLLYTDEDRWRSSGSIPQNRTGTFATGKTGLGETSDQTLSWATAGMRNCSGFIHSMRTSWEWPWHPMIHSVRKTAHSIYRTWITYSICQTCCGTQRTQLLQIESVLLSVFMQVMWQHCLYRGPSSCVAQWRNHLHFT